MSDLIKTRLFPDGLISLELENEAPERARPFWGCLHDMLRFQKFAQLPNRPSWSLSTPALQNKHGAGEVFRVLNVDAKTKSAKNTFPGLDFKQKGNSILTVCIHSDVRELYGGTVQRWAGQAAAGAESDWSDLACSDVTTW